MKQLLSLGIAACACTNLVQANIVTFDVTDGRTIPDYVTGFSQGLASVANASGLFGSIEQVRVFLDLSDGWNGDYYLTLSHAGQKAVLLNRPGVGSGNEFGYADSGFGRTGGGQPMVFSDSAATDVHWYVTAIHDLALNALAGPQLVERIIVPLAPLAEQTRGNETNPRITVVTRAECGDEVGERRSQSQVFIVGSQHLLLMAGLTDRVGMNPHAGLFGYSR